MEHEKYLMGLAVRAMTDNEPMVVNISIAQAWTLASALRLAARHPSITPFSVAQFKEIAEQFELPIVDRYPETNGVLATEEIDIIELEARAARAMADDAPIVVDIDFSQAWYLVSAVQLVTRHPDVDIAFTGQLIDTAKQFERILADRDPEVGNLLAMGWDSQFDVQK